VQTVSSTTVRKALKSNSADMQGCQRLPTTLGDGERRGGGWVTSGCSCTQLMAGHPQARYESLMLKAQPRCAKLSSGLIDMQPALPIDFT